jgi:large subunit ribosomal protein L4
VHLIEAGQLNTYDVLIADEVVFTETALAEYVAGPAKGKGRRLPDLATREIPGGIPSVAPAEGEGTVETTTASEAPAKKATAKKAPATKAAAKKAPAKKAAAAEAPAKKAAAKKAPAKKAAAAKPAADETTEEKA